ncbi:hypothetical protein ES707_10795 [subsurface metagenome]
MIYIGNIMSYFYYIITYNIVNYFMELCRVF